MGDECMCEQCRGHNEPGHVARAWLIGVPASRARGLNVPKQDGLLVAREAGISIHFRPPVAAGRRGRSPRRAARLL